MYLCSKGFINISRQVKDTAGVPEREWDEKDKIITPVFDMDLKE